MTSKVFAKFSATGIDLTRMECKVLQVIEWYIKEVSIDLTRMECKGLS